MLILFSTFTIISALQQRLQPYEYARGQNSDLGYKTIIKIGENEYSMVLDIQNSVSWVYSKNPLNNHACQNCPTGIEIFDCSFSSDCQVIKNSPEITLANSNKCVLAKNSIIIDSKVFENFEICLVYEVTNQEYKINGVISLSPNKSDLFNKLVSKNMAQIFQITTTQGQERVFISESSSYLLQKPINYQNQAQQEWRLQFQLYQKDHLFLTKKENQFITFDLTTKYIWLNEVAITKLILEIKNYDDLFCSLEQQRVMCLCSKPEFINKIPKIKIGFNGLPNNFNLPLNAFFIPEKQKCMLDVFSHETLSILGNSFFKENGAIFDQSQNIIHIGQSNPDQQDKLVFNGAIVICIIAGLLIVLGLMALISILKPISEEELNRPQYRQDPAKPLFVLAKREFRPSNIELSTNNQMIYKRK